MCYNCRQHLQMFLVLCVFVIPVRFPVLSCLAVTVAVSQLRLVPRTPRPDWRALLTLQGYRTTLSNRMSASVCLSLRLSLCPDCLALIRRTLLLTIKRWAFYLEPWFVARGSVASSKMAIKQVCLGILKAKKKKLNWLIKKSF